MALDRSWYNSLVDDDGSNTVGTVWGKDDVNALMQAIDAELARLDAFNNAACKVGNGEPISSGSGVWTNYGYTYEEFDPSAMHAANSDQIYVPTAGVYAVSASIKWPASGAGQRGLKVLVNDAYPQHPGEVYVASTALSGAFVQIQTLIQMQAGWSLSLRWYQDSGVAQVIAANGIVFAVWRVQ